MAGTLTITWTNGNPPGGLYRIGYKYPAWNGNAASAGYPGYVVLNSVPACGTATCSHNITIPIITDYACTPLIITGYVQSSCEPDDQTTNIVPFSITFTPAEPCTAVEFIAGGSGATTPVNLVATCAAGPYGILTAKETGEIFNLCFTGGVGGMSVDLSASIAGAGYTISDNPAICCYECQEITMTYTGIGPGRAQYADCTTGALGTFNPGGQPPGYSQTYCAKPDSWATDDTTNITFTVGGPCP